MNKICDLTKYTLSFQNKVKETNECVSVCDEYIFILEEIEK